MILVKIALFVWLGFLPQLFVPNLKTLQIHRFALTRFLNYFELFANTLKFHFRFKLASFIF